MGEELIRRREISQVQTFFDSLASYLFFSIFSRRQKRQGHGLALPWWFVNEEELVILF
jgi:hypothetical protein